MRWFFAFYIFSVLLGSTAYGRSSVRCENLYVPKGTVRSLFELDRLRLMTFNLENFTFQRDELGEPTKKMLEISKIILDQRPDVIVLQEVSGKDSISEFNMMLLQDRYRIEYIEGHRDTAHHITFLVKKSLSIRYQVRSHINEKWVDPVSNKEGYLFARDYPALIIWPAERFDRPALIVFGNHGKSMIDRPGDPDSVLMRTAQIFRMQKIADDMRKEFGRHVPMVIAGDFNADLTNSTVIHPLRKVFEDAFNLSPIPKEFDDRVTHTYHAYRGNPAALAAPLDAFFVNKSLRDYIRSVRVYRYRDKEGNTLPLPRSAEERLQQPSDHFPVILDIGAEPLMRSAS